MPQPANKDCLGDFNKSIQKIIVEMRADVKANLEDQLRKHPVLSKLDKKGRDIFIKQRLEYAEEALKALRKDMRELEQGLIRGRVDEALADLQTTEGVRRRIIDVMEQHRAEVSNKIDMDLITELTLNKRGIRGAIDTFFTMYDRKVRNMYTRFNAMIENIWDNAHISGKKADPETITEASRIWKESQVDKGKALKAYIEGKGLGDPLEVIYEALYRGNYSGDAVLDMLGKMFRKIDDSFFDELQGLAPYINKQDAHVIPLKPERDKVLAYGKERFIEDFAEHMPKTKDGKEWTLKSRRRTAAGIYAVLENDTTFKPNGAFKAPNRMFGIRKIMLDGIEGELWFVKNFARLDEGVLQEAVNHRHRMLRAAVTSHQFGPNINASLFSLRQNLLNTYPKSVTSSELDNYISKHTKALELSLGRGAVVDELQQVLWEIVQNLITSLTAKSVTRDLFNDKTIANSLIRNQVFGDNQFLALLEATQSSLEKSFKLKGLNNQIRELELMGLEIQIHNWQIKRGYLDDLLDSEASKTMTEPPGFLKEKLTKAALIARNISRLNMKATSRWSGADAYVKGSRLSDQMYVGRKISEGLDNFEWDNLDETMKRAFHQTGMDKTAWEALKHLPKIEYKGQAISLDIRAIDSIPEEALLKAARPGEGLQQVKSRLKLTYMSTHEELASLLNAKPGKRGEMIERPESFGLWQYLKMLFRFQNISLTQNINMRRAKALATGYDPNEVGWMPYTDLHMSGRSVAALIRTAVTHLTGGMLILWTSDLIAGKTPRDITGTNLALAAAASGSGAFLGILFSQFYFNDGDLGAPIKAFTRPLWKAGESAAAGNWPAFRRNMVKFGQKSFGLSNTWWSAKAVEAGAKKALKYPDPYAKKVDHDIGRDDWPIFK